MRKWFASGLLSVTVTGAMYAQDLVIPTDIPSIPPAPSTPTIPSTPPARPLVDAQPALPPVPTIDTTPTNLTPVAPPIPPVPSVPVTKIPEVIPGSAQAKPVAPPVVPMPPSVPSTPTTPPVLNPPSVPSTPVAPAPVIDFSRTPNSIIDPNPAFDLTQPIPNLGGTTPLTGTQTNELAASPFGPPGSNRMWFNAEFIMMWIPRGPLATPLMTIAETGTPRGAVGVRGTVPGFNELDLKLGSFQGGRLRAGGYFDDRHIFGVEGSFFLVAKNEFNFGAQSDENGAPGYYRPVRLDGLGERAYPISIPGSIVGRFDLNATTQFYGWEANAISTILEIDDMNLTAILGFRSLRLEETLTLSSRQRELRPNTLRYLGAAVPSGSHIDILDSFETQSTFYGGQLGFMWSFIEGRWSVALRTTMAFGWTNQRLQIDGRTTLSSPGVANRSAVGGILAQSSNIGNYERDRFAVSPEFNANFGFDITSWARLTAGYNFWYVSRVVRPGYQIDRNIAAGRVPTDPTFGTGSQAIRPAPHFINSFFWGQGLSLGLELHY